MDFKGTRGGGIPKLCVLLNKSIIAQLPSLLYCQIPAPSAHRPAEISGDGSRRCPPYDIINCQKEGKANIYILTSSLRRQMISMCPVRIFAIHVR